MKGRKMSTENEKKMITVISKQSVYKHTKTRRNHVYIVKPLQWRDRTKIDAMKVVLNGRLRL